MPRNPRDALDFQDALGGHASPLRDGLRRDRRASLVQCRRESDGAANRVAGSHERLFGDVGEVIHARNESISFFSVQAPLSETASATFITLRRMRDPRENALEIGQRIADARAAASPKVTQAELARRVGTTRGAVGNWELGRGISREHLLDVAKALRISAEWLATGEGVPTLPQAQAPSQVWRVELAGRVGAGAIIDSEEMDEIAFQGRRHIDLPSEQMVKAVIVDGDSMLPRFYPGEIILYDRTPQNPSELLNRYAVVRLQDATEKIKILREGRKSGCYRLDSHNSEPEEDVIVMAAYRFVALIAAPDHSPQPPPISGRLVEAKRKRA